MDYIKFCNSLEQLIELRKIAIIMAIVIAKDTNQILSKWEIKDEVWEGFKCEVPILLRDVLSSQYNDMWQYTRIANQGNSSKFQCS